MAAERRVYVCGMSGETDVERDMCRQPCPTDAVDPITQYVVGDDTVRMVVDNQVYRCYDRDGLVRWLARDNGQLPDDRTPLSGEQLAHLGVHHVRRQRVANYYLNDVRERARARQAHETRRREAVLRMSEHERRQNWAAAMRRAGLDPERMQYPVGDVVRPRQPPVRRRDMPRTPYPLRQWWPVPTPNDLMRRQLPIRPQRARANERPERQAAGNERAPDQPELSGERLFEDIDRRQLQIDELLAQAQRIRMAGNDDPLRLRQLIDEARRLQDIQVEMLSPYPIRLSEYLRVARRRDVAEAAGEDID